MKKIIYTLILALVFSIGCNVNLCFASASSWAKDDIEQLNQMNLIPEIMKNAEYTESVTRIEFCHLAMNMYKKLSGDENMPLGSSGFLDTYDIVASAANDLGIMKGYENGCFYPQNNITRQEMAAVICRELNLCNINTDVSSSALPGFSDSKEISSWAYDSLAFCVQNNIIKGTSQNEISPLANTSREQAMVIINRCINNFFGKNQLSYDNLGCDVSGDGQLVKYENRALTVTWNSVPGTYVYDINLFLSSDNFWYSNSDTYVQTLYAAQPSATFKNMRAGKLYYITVDAKNENGSVICSYSIYAHPKAMYSLEEKEKIVFPNGEITGKAEADGQMQTITVNAWKINSSGVKYPSTLTLSVHKNIAQVTKMAFEEIFNGEEKFPFKDAGAYSWRDSMSSGRYSHHNFGTAIDLNYNENYCLYKNGSFIGLYWKPNEDIYSISPNGEVVSIFAKYGFVWGGDEWSNPKDYMHFSYLEL